MKITKRDVKFFVLGILTVFIINIIMDWEGVKKSFIEGFEGAYKTETKK
jgi:hypothetical protein